MPQTQWKIQFDWDRDGDYGQTYDDQTSRVIRAKWMLGMYEPYQEVAGDMMLQLILQNDDWETFQQFRREQAHLNRYGETASTLEKDALAA